MDSSLIVAIIAGVVALSSAAIAWRAKLSVASARARQELEAKEQDRRSAAKIALDRYRGPLLAAAWELADRIDNIRRRSFLFYANPDDERAHRAKLTTLFRFAQYFG